MVEALKQPPTSPAVKPEVKATPAPAQVSQVTTGSTATTVTVSATESPNSQELLKRMAETKPSEKPAEEPTVTEYEKETDPKVKEKLLNLEKHYNKKYMELAEKIKQTEQERQSLNTWTPDRVKKEIENPNFQQAASQILQQQTALQAPSNWSGSQEEWSALTSSEKAHIGSLEKTVMEQKNALNGLLSQQDMMLLAQEDEVIKSRNPNYDPKLVDELAVKIQQNQIPRGTLRELMWKAQNFDKAVEQSYRYGREDRNGDIQGKMVASSPNFGSSSAQGSDEVPVQGEKETSQNWFRRVAQYRLDQAKKTGNYTKK